MESLETADLIELVLIQREALNSQLQFWISATFAVIAASFVAGPRLTTRYRLSIGLLYFLTTAMTLTGWAAAGEELMSMYAVLGSRGVTIDPPWVSATLRLMLMVLGTMLTLVFLYHDRSHADGENA